jgi:hypothetical protein
LADARRDVAGVVVERAAAAAATLDGVDQDAAAHAAVVAGRAWPVTTSLPAPPDCALEVPSAGMPPPPPPAPLVCALPAVAVPGAASVPPFPPFPPVNVLEPVVQLPPVVEPVGSTPMLPPLHETSVTVSVVFVNVSAAPLPDVAAGMTSV